MTSGRHEKTRVPARPVRAADGSGSSAGTIDPVTAILRAADPLAREGAADEVASAVARTRAAVGATAATLARRSARRAWSDPARLLPAAAFIRHPAPWGVLHVAASDRGVVAIELASETSDFVDDLARRLHGDVVPAGPHVPSAWSDTLARVGRQLDEYFAGARTSFDVPVDIEGVSPWERLVLDGARSLSYGEATSYGRLAQRIGRPRAARAVGNALGRNPIPIVIPCHRILAGDGTIGGYGGASRASQARMLSVKRTLLAIEGVAVRG